MESRTYRVYVHQWDAGEAAHETNKLIQIICADPGQHSAYHDHEEAEEVLLPLDVRVVLAGPAEQLLARDLDGRVDLQRSGE